MNVKSSVISDSRDGMEEWRVKEKNVISS